MIKIHALNKNLAGYILYFFFCVNSTLLNIVTRISNKHTDWKVMLCLRTLACFSILSFCYFIFKKSQNLSISIRKENLIIGFFNGISIFFWYKIVIAIPMNTAMIISFFVPIAVGVSSGLYFNRKVYIHSLLGMVGCLACVYACLRSDLSLNIGSSIPMICFFIGIRIISNIMQKVVIERKDNNFFSNNLPQMVISFFAFILMALFFKSDIKTSLDAYKNTAPLVILSIAILLAILQSTLMYYAFKLSSDISKIQILEYLRFPLSVVFSYIILKEEATVIQLISGSIIIAINLIVGKINNVKK